MSNEYHPSNTPDHNEAIGAELNAAPPQADAPPAIGPPMATVPSQIPSGGWQRTKFILKAIEVRLRFIGIFVVIGLVIAYWDTIENYWDRWTRPAAAVGESDVEYYCGMHPDVVRDSLDPGGKLPTCPVCGMDLSKRKKGEKPTLPDGVLARVTLSPENVRQAGVKTESIDYRPMVQEIRTVGYVDYDETKLSQIVTRVKGFIEKLYVDETFADVKQDQPLAELYSPELYSSVQELLLAKKYKNDDLVAGGRERLKLFGIDDTEIDALLESNEALPRIMIRSPQTGHVIQKNVVLGTAVEPGMTLFEVADLSTVWIEADVFEKDIYMLRNGQEVEAAVDAVPGEVFRGHVSLVHPHLDHSTRTNRVRMTLDNPGHKLRPGMFATVTIRTPPEEKAPPRVVAAAMVREAESDDGDGGNTDAGDEGTLIELQKICPVTGRPLGSMGKPVKTKVDGQTVFLCCKGCEDPLHESPEKYMARLAPPPEGKVLTVPQQAVIDTGSKKIVYVERDPGVFEAVEVKLGPRSNEFYPVLDGLSHGDKVAAAGAFLIDAETRLNPAAAATYFGASGSAGTGTATTNDGATTPTEKSAAKLGEKELANIDKLPLEDREAAIAQAWCPIGDFPLGSMGKPVKIDIEGQSVFLCCSGCKKKALDNPKETLKKAAELKQNNSVSPK